MAQTVVGVFESNSEAQRARRELIDAGFSEGDVSVQAHPEDRDSSSSSSSSSNDMANTTTGRDGTSDGERFMASVSNFFKDLFGDDRDNAGNYSEAVRRGRAVVSIDVDNETEASRAQQALASAGAVNIEGLAQAWRQEGYTNFDATAQPYTSEQIVSERGKVLPVVREELEVGKREVDLGAVRVFSRTVERPVNETVQLREQHAEIERRPVDRPASVADMQAFQEGSIEVRETAERPVISKTARVVEEVVVGTATSVQEQTVSDTVRNTVVEVERDTQGTQGTQDMRTGATSDDSLTGTTTGTNMGGSTSTTGSTATGMGTTGMSGGMGSSEAGSAAAGMDTPVNAMDFRNHYQSNLASQGRYEDFEPAYSYGSQLRSDERYRNSAWGEIEPMAERDWSQSHPGSTWQKVKDAARHGWESIKR